MKNMIWFLLIASLFVYGCKRAQQSSTGVVDTLVADTVLSDSVNVDSATLFQEMDSYRVENTDNDGSNSSYTDQSGKQYYMIVGCFAVPQNASAYVKKMRDMGYDATILSDISDLQMVSARSYNTYQESIAEIGKFRNEVSQDAWVYVKK